LYGGFKIAKNNVYKAPIAHWDHDVTPALYTGDFISHHLKWGYAGSDTDDDTLVKWAFSNNL